MLNIDTLQIDQELLLLMSEVDEFKGAWRALGTLAPDRLNSLRYIATIESIGSSTRIEGSKLSDQQVATLLSNVAIEKFDNRDAQEVAGYSDIMDLIMTSHEDIHISDNHIKQLHQDLLKHSEKDERHRGQYKNARNDVAAFDQDGNMVGIVFETASPFDTPRKMEALVSWYQTQQNQQTMHPLLIIAIFVVTFLEIHPFQDGNGRLSRALTTLLLLKAGYVYAPYSSLEHVIEKDKDQYYYALRETQKTIRSNAPNWQPWIIFFIKAMVSQKRKLEKKMAFEQNAIEDLSENALKILDLIRDHGRITNRDIVRELGISNNTIKAILSQLVEKHLIKRHGAGRSTWYGGMS